MRHAIWLALVLSGCFDSIVNDHCAAGYSLHDGVCLASSETVDGGVGSGTDAGSGSGGDGGSVCSADTSSDPDNCGACGVVCASGICVDGMCQTGVFGQIIAIGHDYTHYHATMTRVLGNAVALGLHKNVRVARWNGTTADGAVAATTAALNSGMGQLGRAWHQVTLPSSPSATALNGADVLLVDPQIGDGAALQAAAQPWATTFDGFLARGGVIVVLEGSAGVSYRFAIGGGLYTVGAPVDASGSYAYVVDGSDAVAQQVISPYLAETTSVTMPGAPSSVVATTGGDTLVFHIVRPH
jgi:hypothetical protein